MKILLTILTTLLLFVGAGLAFALCYVDNEDQTKSQEIFDQIEDLKASLGGETLDDSKIDEYLKSSIGKGLDDIPTPGQFRIGKILAFLIGLLSLVALISYFLNLVQLRMILCALMFVVVLSIVLHPANDKGIYGGLSNDIFAMLVGGILIAGGLAAYFGNVFKHESTV